MLYYFFILITVHTTFFFLFSIFFFFFFSILVFFFPPLLFLIYFLFEFALFSYHRAIETVTIKFRISPLLHILLVVPALGRPSTNTHTHTHYSVASCYPLGFSSDQSGLSFSDTWPLLHPRSPHLFFTLLGLVWST